MRPNGALPTQNSEAVLQASQDQWLKKARNDTHNRLPISALEAVLNDKSGRMVVEMATVV